jgi:hypothetical protein
MHIASKITLLIGAIMLIGGVIGTIGGVTEFGDTVEGQTYIKGESSGTFTINENQSWDIAVYLIHPVDCQSVELTIVDSFGTDVIEDNWNYGCSDNERTFIEGERELYGNIMHDKVGMEYTLNSNVNVDISGEYCDEACIDSAIGGIFAILGGGLGICCAIPMIILGTILAFTLDDNKTNTIMQSGQMPTGQVAYQTPVSGQVAYQTPITEQVPMTQTFNQTPVSQVIQPSAVPVTPITPPLTQTSNQTPVEQVTQPAAVPVTQDAPVTPITPPTTQQPSVGQDTQSEKSPWWGDEPQQ